MHFSSADKLNGRDLATKPVVTELRHFLSQKQVPNPHY